MITRNMGRLALTLTVLFAVLPASPAGAQHGGGHGGGSHGGGSHGGGSHGGGSHGGGSHGGGSHGGVVYGGGHGYGYDSHHYWSSLGWWYGSPYWGRGGVYSSAYRGVRFALIDTDISPETAEVWLDGTYAGVADDFDGRPDFLYLKPGRYRLEFRAAGYEPYVVDLSVSSGQRVNLDTRMRRGSGGDEFSSGPARGSLPAGRMFEPGGKAVAQRDPNGAAPDEDARRSGDDSAGYGRDSRMPAGSAMEGADTGRLRIHVSPDDAAVYLDDRLLGTGEDLAAGMRGVRATEGEHTIVVTRPGYATKTIAVRAVAGSAVDVTIALEKQAVAR